MTCPSEARWMLLLDGVLPRREARRMEAHESGCPRCSALAARLRAMVAALVAAGPAGRRVCPPRERLAAFAEGELAAEGRARLAAHLAACHACREDLEDWRSLAGDGARDSIWVVLRDGLAAAFALGGLERAALARAVARGRRDRTAPVRFTRSWDADLVAFHLRPGARRGEQDLTVRLAPPPSDPLALRAELLEGGQTLEARTLDEEGSVVFDGLGPGAYRVRLRDMLGRRTLEVDLHLG